MGAGTMAAGDDFLAIHPSRIPFQIVFQDDQSQLSPISTRQRQFHLSDRSQPVDADRQRPLAPTTNSCSAIC
jgi:hypothetical protein